MGGIFCAESDDPMLAQEIALLVKTKSFFFRLSPRRGTGKRRRQYSSAQDLTAVQKRKILYDNPIRLFGAL